jgi:hypothetical protein
MATIRNDSPRQIRIYKIAQSCDCIDIAVPPEPIPPGGELPLTLQWDTTGRTGDSSTTIGLHFVAEGEQERDLPDRRLAVIVHGTVLPRYELIPETVRIDAANPTPVQLRLKSNGDKSLRILSVTSTSDSLLCTVAPDGLSADVSLAGNKTNGAISDIGVHTDPILIVQTSDAILGRRQLPVRIARPRR